MQERAISRDVDLLLKKARDVPGDVDVTVIVVNYNTVHLIDRMMSALMASAGDEFSIQLIVVDNASRDNSVDFLRTNYPSADLIANSVNVGFGRANNQALPLIRGRFVLLLNTDAFIAEDTLRKTIDYMESHPQCGILGAKLVGEDGELQPSCRYFPTPWNDFLASTRLQKLFPWTQMVDDMSWDHASVRECDWVPGCYYLVRRAVVDQIGLFDPRYFLYFEEVDHCKSARDAGWLVVYYPFTRVVHIGGESAKSQGAITKAGRQIADLEIESKMLFFRKHYGRFAVAAAFALLAIKVAISKVKKFTFPGRSNRLEAMLGELSSTHRILQATNFGSRPTR